MSGELHADDEQFARLAFRHLEGLATAEEGAELALLLKREPARLAQFASIARQHGLLSELLTVPGASPAIVEPTVTEPPIGGATQALRRSSRRERVFRRRRPTGATGWFAAAAALALVVLGGVLMWESRGAVVGHLHSSTITTAGGQAVRAGDQVRPTIGDHLVLRDGSRIGFSAGTRVTVVNATRIEVAQGMVMVDAAPRASDKALVIASPVAEARVVGTRFAVAVDTLRTRLDVSEGLVRFTRSADGAVLDVPADAWAEVADGAPFIVHRRAADKPDTPAPAADPFVFGVNLNGGPVTIAGNRWWSQAEAVTHGLVLPELVDVTATAVTPVPAVERAVAGMLNTAIHRVDRDLPLSMPLADGAYDVDLWLMENYRPGHRSLTIAIEGTVVAERVQDGDAMGVWHRLSYPVTISDGRLDLVLGGAGQQPHLWASASNVGEVRWERGLQSAQPLEVPHVAAQAEARAPSGQPSPIGVSITPRGPESRPYRSPPPRRGTTRRCSMSLARLLVAFLLYTSLIAADNTLRVSPDGRSLVKADGSAFFWLGDTAWELFHRLNREEAEQYLSTRANQGYSLIQAVAVAELDGVNTPNPYGHKPFTSTNPTLVMNDAYFQHVDWIVNRANALGMYIGLLPTWGDQWNSSGGVFNTTDKARAYGEFMGNRYRNAAVVWILGGDRGAGDAGHQAILRAMAAGLESTMGGRQLITFHPPGGQTSATWFHNDAWLDFNMQQNGHCTNTDVWNRIANDRNRTPTKPVLDGEPLYESHPICFNAGANGYSNATDIRKFAYWSVFAGALGHTYGCHSVWQMYDVGRGGINGPQQYWHQALTLPGAVQMGHVRRLMDSRPLNGRVPDQSLLTTSALSGGDRIQATRGGDGGYALIYSASGQGFTVDLTKLSGATITAWWFDPRSGSANGAGSFAKSGTRSFSPPANGYGNDWVLVLDDAARGYPVPGGTGGGNPAPSCQLTAPSNGATYSAPATITLSATASDSNGSVARVEFYAGATKLGEDTSAPYDFTWSNAPGGVHTLSARAIDNQGAEGTSASATVTVTTAGFVLGVNLGGGAVTIEGNAWRSDATARSNGMTTSAPNVATTNVTPSPATDSATSSMLNSAIWGGSFSVGQTITNGSYDVYLWVIENYQSNIRRFDVRVEGTTVASGIGNLALGAWVKYGPYRTSVNDGRLDLDLVAVAGDPHLMGFAVFSAGSGGVTWSNGGVGAPGVAGSAAQNGNTWTVRGGGDDIWNASDNFHFVHQPLSGDGEITVRVASQTNTDPWAKAGVMIREGLAGNARHAMMVVTPGNGVAFQRRTSSGGASAHTAGSRATAPVWLRLVRVGNVITGYESGTGSNWVMVGSVTLTLGANVRIGLCVTSHNNAVLSTALFESVTVITAPGGAG